MAWVEGAGVIHGGEGKVLVYAAEQASITSDDLIGELVDISGMGASRETKEYGGFHYKSKHKVTGQSTPNDVNFTENMTKAQLDKVRGWYKNNTEIYVGVLDVESKETLYACKGYISQWGQELPDGDVCKLTYTMAISDDEPEVQMPTVGE